MSSTVKSCPRCRNLAHTADAVSGHDATHIGSHQLLHGNPLGAVLAGGFWMIGKLIPKEYHCTSCGHKFHA
jgi:hypothetical protein